MPDNVVDTLSIQINSTSQGASKAINALITNLGRLNGALGNYSSGASQYNAALDNLSGRLTNLSNSIARLDSSKLDSISKSLSSLANTAKKLNGAFGNTGMDKATSQAKAMDAQMEQAAKKLMSYYGTAGSEANKVKAQFADFYNGIQTWKGGKVDDVSDKAFGAYENLYATLSKNAKISAVQGADEYSKGIVEYMRTHKIPVHLPFDWREVEGDINSAKSKLASTFGVGGWTFNNPKGYGDISSFVSQMNGELGMQMDTSSDARAFEALSNAVIGARQSLAQFESGTTEIKVDMNDLWQQLSNVSAGVVQFDSNMANSTAQMTSNPFTELANGLRELTGIQVPNLDGLANLSANISKLGWKSANQGIANLPLLANGLRSLEGIAIPQIPNLEGLASLIATFNKLGGKTGTGAAANIQPMIEGLKQLSALEGMKFPDGAGLMSLANAFSALGRVTAGRAVDNIPRLADAFMNMMQTLSNAPKVSENVIRLAEAMGRLPGNMDRASNSSKKLENSLVGIFQKSRNTTMKILQFGKGLLTSGKHAESAGSRYSALASKVGLLYAKFWMLMRVVRIFNRIISVASSLTEVQNVVDSTFGNMSKKIEDFSKTSIKSFGMSELSAKQYASRFQAMGTSMGITGKQVQDAQKFLNMRKTLEGNVAGYNKSSNSMADMSVNLTKLTSDLASFYDVDQKVVAGKLASGILANQSRPLRDYGINLTDATLKEWAMKNGLDSNIKSMTQAQKTMLRYQYVMANTTRQQGDFARTANTWHNQVVILKQQLEQLAAVIGSGLIQALKPFVMQFNAALGGLISFSEKVVNALGKIFGWQMEVNAKGLAMDDESLADIDTSGLDDVTDSADKATEATKKLKDQLQGFDKLNVLRTQQNTPKSGSGGKGKGDDATATPSGMSDGQVAAALKRTKGLFESNIDSLFELGRYISDTLSKAMESINWEKIYEKARNWGTGLANFLNGLITPRLFANVGKSIASGLNTELNFLDSFGTTFNWKNFGTSIGAGINNFLYTFDWKTAFSAAKAWGTGLANLINNAIITTDFSMLGKTLANQILLKLDFLYNLGSKIKWDVIGQKLADGINGFINNFPAKQFANTIDAWVQGIFDLFVNALSNIKWSKVADKIAEFIRNLDFKTLAIVISALTLIKAASLTITIANALLTEICRQFVAQLAGKIAVYMAADKGLQTAIGGGLGKAAATGTNTSLGEAVAPSALTKFANWAAVIGGVTMAVAGFVKMWKEGWSVVGEIIKDMGIAIAAVGAVALGFIGGPWAALIAGITIGVSSLAILIHDNWDSISRDLKKKWKELKDSLGELGKGFVQVGEGIGKFAKDTASKIGGFFKSVGESAHKGVANANVLNAFKKVADRWGPDVRRMTEDAKGKIKDLGDKARGHVDNIRTNTSNTWDKIKTITGTKWEYIKSTVTTKAGNIRTNSQSAFREVYNSARDKFESVRRVIGDKFGSVWDTVKRVVNNIRKAFNFRITLPKIKLPHIQWHWKSFGNFVRLPVFDGVRWYRKAYDNPMMFTKPTVMPDMRGYGDGNGGEMVYGHANLMRDIESASGGNEMANIGNRQLANDQRIIQLLSVIAEKDYGISPKDIFSAVRNEASDYTMRTGRGAFEY